MSWFDEAVARRQRGQRAPESAEARTEVSPGNVLARQQQEVQSFDPLVQRLLTEYAEHVFGKGLLQRRFLVRLERPSKSGKKVWNWHWHLDSLVKHMGGVELHPNFDANGIIQSFVLISNQKRVEVPTTDEVAIKEGLVSLYLQ